MIFDNQDSEDLEVGQIMLLKYCILLQYGNVFIKLTIAGFI